MIIRLGTRGSSLALKQVDEIKKALPSINFEVITFETQGDKDKITPFSDIEGSDFFTREIEEALLNKEIDAAVHSAKDLEQDLPEGLAIAAITASISPYECLVSRGNKKLEELASGAKIGTSSQKRNESIIRFRSDLQIYNVRGTIEERLLQLDEGRFDALIMAHAALLRLGYEQRVAEIIPPSIIKPHPLQGCLAVQVRSEDKELIRLFSVLDSRRKVDENQD